MSQGGSRNPGNKSDGFFKNYSSINNKSNTASYWNLSRNTKPHSKESAECGYERKHNVERNSEPVGIFAGQFGSHLLHKMLRSGTGGVENFLGVGREFRGFLEDFRGIIRFCDLSNGSDVFFDFSQSGRSRHF